MARGGPAWIPVRITIAPARRIRFGFLRSIFKSRFRGGCVRPKSANTISHVSISCAPISSRVRKRNRGRHQAARYSAVVQVAPRDGWSCLDDDCEDAGVMSRIYKVGILHEHIAKNPVLHVETRSRPTTRPLSSRQSNACDPEILPLASSLHPGAHLRRHGAPRFGDAGAALVGLTVGEGRIRIRSAGQTARMARPKQKAPMATCRYIPCSRASCVHGGTDAFCLRWGFCFPSLKAAGRVPLSASVFVADHLRPAAKKAGVHIEDGQRFGLHNLRHSLSNWLVNKAKSNPRPFKESFVTRRFRRRSICTRRTTAMKRGRRRGYLTALGVVRTWCSEMWLDVD